MSRTQTLSDAQWARMAPLMPAASKKGGRPFQDHRRVVEAIVWRFRTGSPWRDLTQGDLSSYKNLREEPADHAIGRSRGGLSTKIHHLVDGRGLPLVVLVGPGQAGDAPMFPVLMDHLRVARRGPGRPRTRPGRVRGDKAYSSRAIRTHLRGRGIIAVIPEPSDQRSHRRRRGSRGGRPVGYDVEDYKSRNVVERGFNEDKQWRGLATRYDKLALTYRGGAVLRAITL